MNEISNKKNFLLTLSTGSLRSIIPMIISFLILPLSVHYWGETQYGILAIILTILAYVGNTNLGINAAATILINKNPNIYSKKKMFWRSLKLIIAVVVIFEILFVSVFLLFNNLILIFGKIPLIYLKDANIALLIFGSFIFINLPFSILTSGFYGFHRAYIDNMCSFFRKLSPATALIVVILIKGNLIDYAIIGGVLNLIINGIEFILFKKFLSKISKKIDEIEVINIPLEERPSTYQTILKTGIWCFSGGLANLVVYNTDNIVVGRILGLKDVTKFSIMFKLFSAAFTVIYLLNVSIVPILGKEIGNKNFATVKKIYDYSFYAILFIGGLIWIEGLLCLRNFIYIWVGKVNYAGFWVLFFLGAYAFIFCIVNLNNIMLNTFGFVKESQMYLWMEALVNLGVSILFCFIWGLPGIALGTFLGTFVSTGIFFPRLLKKLTNGLIIYNRRVYFLYIIVILIPFVLFATIVGQNIKNIPMNFIIGIIIIPIYTILYYLILPKTMKKKARDICVKKLQRIKGC